MTAQKKTMVVLGLLLIAMMIAIGSFSLGVYTGKQGWEYPVPSLVNPQQAQKSGLNNPNKQDINQLPSKPDLVGIVARIDIDTLDIKTHQGIHSINISPETVFLDQRNSKVKPAEFSDLQSGNPIAVIGEFQAGTRILIADIIVLLRPKPQ